jgi:hypothetical protein
MRAVARDDEGTAVAQGSGLAPAVAAAPILSYGWGCWGASADEDFQHIEEVGGDGGLAAGAGATSTVGGRRVVGGDGGEAEEGEGGRGVEAARREEELGGGSPTARGRKQS